MNRQRGPCERVSRKSRVASEAFSVSAIATNHASLIVTECRSCQMRDTKVHTSLPVPRGPTRLRLPTTGVIWRCGRLRCAIEIDVALQQILRRAGVRQPETTCVRTARAHRLHRDRRTERVGGQDAFRRQRAVREDRTPVVDRGSSTASTPSADCESDVQHGAGPVVPDSLANVQGDLLPYTSQFYV
jgi:hypothetical protein